MGILTSRQDFAQINDKYLRSHTLPSNGVVHKLKINDLYRIIELDDGQKLKFPISSSITESDRVVLTENSLSVVCKNGLCKISPLYEEDDFFLIGNKRNKIKIKQITSTEELNEQKYLETFHYRNRNTFGKNSKLIATVDKKGFPLVLGYIELNIASIMNKARNQILDDYYNDGFIEWKKWDFGTRGKYSKTIVSISRVVVHPEFRGLGISKILLKHAFLFIKDYWQVDDVKPIFVEIVADMLKFVPFATSAGMLFIGNTEGNVTRLKKDLKYYAKHKNLFLKKGETNSLIKMQAHYVKKLDELLKQNNYTIDELINIIENYKENEIKTKLSFLDGIIRFPKPTYMIGLSEYAHSFLDNRVLNLKIEEPKNNINFSINPIRSPIIFRNVGISFNSKLKLTERTQTVKEAFGLSIEQLNTEVLSDFNCNINPGEIVLITGSSGTGKTTILDILRGKIKPSNGEIILPRNAKLGLLRRLPNDKPLVEIIGKSVQDSLYILNKSGLSEPYLYLRKFDELSNGQQYRAMIAGLLGNRCNVWIADEFLNSLDLVTSNIVASNIRNFVKKLGITLIVASSNTNHYIDSLKPDKILEKEFGTNCKIISYSN